MKKYCSMSLFIYYINLKMLTCSRLVSRRRRHHHYYTDDDGDDDHHYLCHCHRLRYRLLDASNRL